MTARWREGEALRLGPDVVQHLIPHRRPLLMVDGVDAFRPGERPELWARRHISANEEVFAGHFPGLHLWPGIYTIEGLGQATLLSMVIARLGQRRVATGGRLEDVARSLRELELHHQQLRPTAAPPIPGLPVGGARPDPTLGMAGHVDVKLIAPVFGGQELRYHVALTHVVGAMARFEVDAEVAGKQVARGSMTGITRA